MKRRVFTQLSQISPQSVLRPEESSNSWPVTREPQQLQKRRRFWELERLRESVVEFDDLSDIDMQIHDAHKAAVRRGHFTYDCPAGRGVVETRYKHFLTDMCCGRACRHCIFNFYNVPKYLRISKTFNSSFWVSIPADDAPEELQLDLKNFFLRRLPKRGDSAGTPPLQQTATWKKLP